MLALLELLSLLLAVACINTSTLLSDDRQQHVAADLSADVRAWRGMLRSFPAKLVFLAGPLSPGYFECRCVIQYNPTILMFAVCFLRWVGGWFGGWLGGQDPDTS